MSHKLYIFPEPLDASCQLISDDNGVVINGAQDTHPSGRIGISFIIPDEIQNSHGAQLLINPVNKINRGLLILGTPTSDQAIFAPDDFQLVNKLGFGQVNVVNDHFELNGKRWPWRMMTGFCDYKVFLDGPTQRLRDLLKQSQDLGCHGRRVLPHIVNIVDFNPDSYGNSFYDRAGEYLAINAEYEQYVDFPVLSDTGYRGWSLSKCQTFWARFIDSTRGSFNKFINLTNEYDHEGNLVGNPNDYARPSGLLVSQGSAVQDSTPPSPGWDYREWHAPDNLTHLSHEYYIWKGLSTGGEPKPTVISEHPRIDENNANEDVIRTIAYASLANGCGLTVHTDDGKYSRLLGPNQAKCVKTAMDILATSN